MNKSQDERDQGTQNYIMEYMASADINKNNIEFLYAEKECVF